MTHDSDFEEVRDDYVLLDTGGIGMELEMTLKKIAIAEEEQAEFAIQAASVVLFIVDVRIGVTPLDEIVAEKLSLRKARLVVNKVDLDEIEADADEFIRLGLGELYSISAEHVRRYYGPRRSY